MNQNISTEWLKTERIIFRLTFCYLLFYFIFLSDFFFQILPFQEYIHAPFKYVSDGFISLVNRLFIHKVYNTNIYTGMGDTSWFILGCFSYLIVSFFITAVWTILDKRKSYTRLFLYLQTYSRYYLAFVLFTYGSDKLFSNQFPDPTPDHLIQSLGNTDTNILLWTLMGASKAYNLFGGMFETITGLLLLFKRTSTLGSLVSMSLLINILFLDISSNTMVKSLLVHLILISIFILSPDIKRLFSFFFRKKNTSLTTIPVGKRLYKYQWLRIGLKFIIIAFVVFKLIQHGLTFNEYNSKPFLGGLDGVYEIIKFELNQQSHPPLTTDTLRWRRLAINKFGDASIQFMNDSISSYGLRGDTASKSIQLTVWNDTIFKSKFRYSIIGPETYLFEGAYKNDSIRAVARKLSFKDFPLMKDKGKVKWVWW